jgi:hypothetical protein
LLLLRSKVLPGFHAVQNPLLLFWRTPAEILQSLLELLLSLRRQSAKLRIVLQGSPLLIGRHISVLTQPLARMMSLHGWLALFRASLWRIGGRLRLA